MGEFSKLKRIAENPKLGFVVKADHEPVMHWSDCAIHNAPAMFAGECDCGAISKSK